MSMNGKISYRATMNMGMNLTLTLQSHTVIVMCAIHTVRSVRYNVMISYRPSNHTPSVERVFLVCIF